MCGCLSRTPLLGTWPNTQACALTRNRTGNPLACGMMPNQLSCTGEDCFIFFKMGLGWVILCLVITQMNIYLSFSQRACYGVLRFIMESGAKGCEVVVSGKLR